jgi:hypothetical protein
LGPENFSGSPAAVIFYTVEFVRGAVTVPLYISRRDCLTDTAQKIAAGLVPLAELRADPPAYKFSPSQNRGPCHVAYAFVRRRAESLSAFFAL